MIAPLTMRRPQDGGLDARQAGSFAGLALANIAQTYPHKLDHVLDSDADVVVPKVLHPAFHGSYDWHSCVHMHWLLVHLVSAFPQLPQRSAVEAQLDASFAPDPIAAECRYLARPGASAFERTYGWAWLLKLATELACSSHSHAKRWSQCLAPLAEAIVARYLAYLPKADYPIRHGTHANSAFGLLFAL
ncbi:MAG: DUF2891 family protein, partial [Casimicrobiaceae bacterium]